MRLPLPAWLGTPEAVVKHSREREAYRLRRRAAICRPQLQELERRWLFSATCTISFPSEPWCYDDDFGSVKDGHAIIDPSVREMELGRAVHLQDVAGEQRILIAGYGFATSDADNPKFAIARLCTDGALDNGVNCGSSPHNGFGIHPSGTGAAPGWRLYDFFDDAGTGVYEDLERINAIAIQRDYSSFCDGTTSTALTDKIIVAGRVLHYPSTVRHTWGLVRYCANGEIDQGWGGHNRDYETAQNDAPGTKTIGFADNSGGSPDWSRNDEPFALAIEPGANSNTADRIVVAGTAKQQPPPGVNDKAQYFAIARLCHDGKYDNGNYTDAGGATHAGECGTEGFGPKHTQDFDLGRIWFDADNSSDSGTYRDGNTVQNFIRGIQLVQDASDNWDILIAGATRKCLGTNTVETCVFVDPVPTNVGDSDFFIARIKHNGDQASSSNWNPYEWKKTRDFSSRDDLAFDIAHDPDSDAVIVTGPSCATNECIFDDTNGAGGDAFTKDSAASDFAYAKYNYDATNSTEAYAHRVTTGSGLGDPYTNIPYSVVLQTVNQVDYFVLGGYSLATTGGGANVPYMSGARFKFADGSNSPTDYDYFRSNFDSSTFAGDQAWELRVQSNNRIVAGGIHTTLVGGARSMEFAAIRLCQTPSDACDSTEDIPPPPDSPFSSAFNEIGGGPVLRLGTIPQGPIGTSFPVPDVRESQILEPASNQRQAVIGLRADEGRLARQLSTKQATLPRQPPSDDDVAMTPVEPNELQETMDLPPHNQSDASVLPANVSFGHRERASADEIVEQPLTSPLDAPL